MTLTRRTPLKAKKAFKKPCPTVEGLMKSGLVSKGSTFKAKKKPMKKRSKTNEGWYDVGLEIWAERRHECVVCSKGLEAEKPDPSWLSHLLPRGSYRRYKRDPRNILIKCSECHGRWHQNGPDVLRAYPEWKEVTDRYYELRDEANGI